MYAEVLVEVAARRVDKLFSYYVPERLRQEICVGSRVQVPFGKRLVAGYVVGLGCATDVAKIKEISTILDPGPLFTPMQYRLARWMAAFYLCNTVSALQAIIGPRLQSAGPLRIRRLWAVVPEQGEPDFSRSPKQAAIWSVARARPGLTRHELAKEAKASASVVDTMVNRGFLRFTEQKSRRDPYPLNDFQQTQELVLNVEQAAVYSEISGSLESGQHGVFLLHGVTGSGKTEIYLQSIRRVLELKRQAIVLVPEISLTPQMVSSFKERFGEQVAVLHSRLSHGERYDEYNRIMEGAAPVVLGARSAIFAPVNDPGLIVIDEEHEPSYKQDETPKYHARDVAIRLSKNCNGVVLLGSATPSLESYARAMSGGPYKLLKMTKRVEEKPLPRVQVVDMRGEMKSGNPDIFSRALLKGIHQNLEDNQQVILFLNRRGFSTFVVCRECGTVMKCPHCDISLTHHSGDRMRCHYCSYNIMSPRNCPECQSKYIGYLGTGTQKVEHEVKTHFPGARVLRMDADTTSRKGSHSEILQSFRNGEADILIGTQMVAKGLDFPGVTLVGVISADTTLYMPDLRASERTFQLLTQVAGRAGRGDAEGRVLIQTYSPDHFAVQAASRHDFGYFFSREITLRHALEYPPFSRLARVLVTGIKEEDVQKACGFISEGLIRSASAQGVDIQVMGPAPASVARIKDCYRWQLMIKAKVVGVLREAIQSAMSGFNELVYSRKVSVSIDIDPYSMM